MLDYIYGKLGVKITGNNKGIVDLYVISENPPRYNSSATIGAFLSKKHPLVLSNDFAKADIEAIKDGVRNYKEDK